MERGADGGAHRKRRPDSEKMVSRHQPGRCKRTTMRELMVVEDVLLESMFPELLPAGASSGPLPFDKAMAARSTRTSSSEEDAKSTDEEDRLLAKRCIEWQWKDASLEQNTSLRVKRLPCDHESDVQSCASEKRSKSAQPVNFNSSPGRRAH